AITGWLPPAGRSWSSRPAAGTTSCGRSTASSVRPRKRDELEPLLPPAPLGRGARARAGVLSGDGNGRERGPRPAAAGGAAGGPAQARRAAAHPRGDLSHE